MIVTRTRAFSELLGLRQRWDQLAQDQPFRQWDWCETWWRHFRERGDLYVLAVTTKQDEVIAIVPWFLENHPIAGRMLRFIGSGETCADYLDVLVDAPSAEEVGQVLAQWLLEQSDGGEHAWDTMHWEGVSRQEPGLKALLQALVQRECTIHEKEAMSCWRVNYGASWDDYLKGLSKPHRKHMRVSKGKLDADPDLKVITARSESEWNSVWPKFVDLHQRRRVSLGQAGCFANEAFHEFLMEVSSRFLASRRSRLMVVEKGGEPISSLLSFTGGTIAYGYQMGTNPDYLSESPGWLLVAAAVQEGLRCSEQSLDLLRGDESYKSRMGGLPTPMSDVRIIPPQMGARLRHTAWLTGKAFKRWVKNGLQVTGFGPGSAHPSCAQ